MSVPYYPGLQADVDDIRPMRMADGTFILRRILPRNCSESGSNWIVCRWPLGYTWADVYPQSGNNPLLQWLGGFDRNVHGWDEWQTKSFVQATQYTNPDVVQLVSTLESSLDFGDAPSAVSGKVKFRLYDRRGIEVSAFNWTPQATVDLHASGVIEGVNPDTMAMQVWAYDDLTTLEAPIFEAVTDEDDAGYRLTLGVKPHPDLAFYSYLELGATVEGFGGTVTDFSLIMPVERPPGIHVSIPWGYSMEPGESITFLSKIVQNGSTDTDSPGVSGRVEIIGKDSSGGEEEIGGGDVDAEDFTEGEAETDIAPEYPPGKGPGDYTGFEARFVKVLHEERDGRGGPNPGPVPGLGEPPDGWVKLGQSALDTLTYPDAVIVTVFGLYGEGDIWPDDGEIPFLLSRDGTQNGRPKYAFGHPYQWLGEMLCGNDEYYWQTRENQAPYGTLAWVDNGDETGFWQIEFKKANLSGSDYSKGKFALTADAAAANIPSDTLDGYPTADEADKGSWVGSGDGRWYPGDHLPSVQPVELQVVPIMQSD